METGSDSRHGNPPAGRGILCPGQLAADGPGNNARRENIEDDSVDIEDDPIEVEDTHDSFEALQARAAAYRSAAGCDIDGSSDDSSSDELVVAAGPGPIVLSPATQALLSSPALSRMRAMGALGKRSTGRQLSPEGESSEVRIFFSAHGLFSHLATSIVGRLFLRTRMKKNIRVGILGKSGLLLL